MSGDASVRLADDVMDVTLDLSGMPEHLQPLATEMTQVIADVMYLASNGALAGVAEVVHERRRQLEKGWTVRGDDALKKGWLVAEGMLRSAMAWAHACRGTGGYPEVEEGLREAAALYAAEIDRLNRMMAGHGQNIMNKVPAPDIKQDDLLRGQPAQLLRDEP